MTQTLALFVLFALAWFCSGPLRDWRHSLAQFLYASAGLSLALLGLCSPQPKPGLISRAFSLPLTLLSPRSSVRCHALHHR